MNSLVEIEGIPVAKWRSARENYKYPAVCLRNGCEPYLALENQPTCKSIEQYHREYLLSGNYGDQVQALASITFWGFYASADPARKPTRKRALTRAIWAKSGMVRGVGNATNLKPILCRGRNLVLEKKFGAAWEEYRKIPNIGPSFASKLVAFADPENAAILDKVVRKKIEELRLSDDLQAIVFRMTAENYQKWCEWCQKISRQLNAHGEVWTSFDSRLNQWRAIDVERAIFSLPSPANDAARGNH